jgi:succinyl-CoA synthetase alpha subunit
MSIFINKDTKVITQGITGKTGQFHTEKCQEYANGKNCFVAGVNPKKAGEKIFDIPIFGSVKEAKGPDQRMHFLYRDTDVVGRQLVF